ncbi:MAG: sugar phosphate nucleotidyltransferase [Phycisphaerae bacterium]
MRAIILAGGKGTRLRPYTTFIPKPLVPIGNEMPILEVIIRQLARCGFTHVTLTVNHLANLIMSFFGDGAKWNVHIDYSIEDEPLGTVGPLTLIPDLPEDFLVMNGDILCDLNYQTFFQAHLKHGKRVTVSTYQRDARIDYGVLEWDQEHIIRKFVEKPTYHFDVSMGIYCFNRAVVTALKKREKYSFDNLILDGIAANARYQAIPFEGFWLDIGRPEDYDYCNENFAEIRKKLDI